MDKIFEYRKKLNIKKILIILGIILLIILIVITSKYFINQKYNSSITEITSKDDSNPNITFVALDNSFTLELSKSFGFNEYKPARNYLLEIRNEEKNIDIYFSKFNVEAKRSLIDIITDEQQNYIKNFKYYSNISDVKQIDNENNYETYTYSLQYLDSKENITYYLQDIWIKNNNDIYIIDIEFPQDSITENSNLITTILNEFKLNK